jgi:hypothetical protein
MTLDPAKLTQFAAQKLRRLKSVAYAGRSVLTWKAALERSPSKSITSGLAAGSRNWKGLRNEKTN